jgi:hypothetical protein
VTLSTIVSMLIGAFIPALEAVITKENLPAHLRVLILLALTTISGALSSVLGSLPSSLNGWEHLALNVLLTFAIAAAADVAGWIPSGASKAIHKATDSWVGIGPPA